MESRLLEHLNDVYLAMPLVASHSRPTHVLKSVRMQASVFGMVARAVGRQEMLSHPKAITAMDKEWERLQSKGA